MRKPLKKGHQNHEKNMKKSDFVQSTTYKKLCKKSKIIDIFKNAFKNDIEIVRKKNVKKRILLKHPPSRSFVKKQVPLKFFKKPLKRLQSTEK